MFSAGLATQKGDNIKFAKKTIQELSSLISML